MLTGFLLLYIRWSVRSLEDAYHIPRMRWWWKETEIDMVGLKGGKALAIEAKWTGLNYQDAKKPLFQLNIKANKIPKAKECILGVMPEKIGDKEKN